MVHPGGSSTARRGRGTRRGFRSLIPKEHFLGQQPPLRVSPPWGKTHVDIFFFKETLENGRLVNKQADLLWHTGPRLVAKCLRPPFGQLLRLNAFSRVILFREHR